MAIVDRLVPKVRFIEESEGCHCLDDPIRIALDASASEMTRNTANLLMEDLSKATGLSVEISSETNAILLSVKPSDNPEAYSIIVTPESIVIEGAGEPGLFYGTRTLLQLMDNNQIPCCNIRDYPDYKNRMVHYDLAREQTCNMKHLKHVIDILSNHKVNMLHLYLENRFQFQEHLKVSPPGVMTPDQARDLDQYAAERFVELVPEVNCLAHLENALCVDEYSHLSENPDSPWEICTQNPEAVAFVEDLVREVVSCFRTQYFHMGGDEAWQMGKCPKCAARIQRDGGKHVMFGEHYSRIAEFIKSLGKRPMMWGDMLLDNKGAAEIMSKDIIIFDWHYDKSSVDTVKYFTGQGFDVYVCPAMSGYDRLAAPYAQATNNIYNFIGQGIEGGAIGECTCAWELRQGHYFTNDYWGILLSADRAWNIDNGGISDFEKRFCKEFFGVDDLRPINYYRELSDGYASIFEPGIPRHSPLAFGALDSVKPYGDKVTREMLEASEEKFNLLMEMLSDLKSSVKRNSDALEFADLPAYSTRMMLRKISFSHQVDELIAYRLDNLPESIEDLQNMDFGVADFKLIRAISLLKEMKKDLEYFEPRFKQAIELYGGSEVDIKRVETMQGQIEEKMMVAKSLMSV